VTSHKFNETISGAFSKLYYNDLDFYLHYSKLTAFRHEFSDGVVANMRPLYQILGGVYNNKFQISSKMFDYVHSFDSMV